MVNTIDPQFFEDNIAEGYRQRKERHSDKDNVEISMNLELYHALMNSNQVVHNRGKALSYLCGSKKRYQQDSGDEAMEVKQRKAPHQYEMKTRVNDGRTLDRIVELKLQQQLQQQQQRSVPKSLHPSEQQQFSFSEGSLPEHQAKRRQMNPAGHDGSGFNE